MQLMSIKNPAPYYLRIDAEDETGIPDKYETQQETINDATRFYHDHFNMGDDYDENFEVKDFAGALSFWEANGYMIIEAKLLNYKGDENETDIVKQKAEALANHLGVNPSEIILPSSDDYDDEFQVNFGYANDEENLLPIEVVTAGVAIGNEKDNLDNIDDFISKNNIGCYTRIIGTEFYFRWL